MQLTMHILDSFHPILTLCTITQDCLRCKMCFCLSSKLIVFSKRFYSNFTLCMEYICECTNNNKISHIQFQPWPTWRSSLQQDFVYKPHSLCFCQRMPRQHILTASLSLLHIAFLQFVLFISLLQATNEIMIDTIINKFHIIYEVGKQSLNYSYFWGIG